MNLNNVGPSCPVRSGSSPGGFGRQETRHGLALASVAPDLLRREMHCGDHESPPQYGRLSLPLATQDKVSALGRKLVAEDLEAIGCKQ